MATITKRLCDACDSEMALAEGEQPATVLVYAKTPAGIGKAFDQHELCAACWQKICTTFPKFKDAERLVQPAPIVDPPKQLPSEMDTWSPEQVLMALAKKLGVQVKPTPDE
jgi:hypothetical protein